MEVVEGRISITFTASAGRSYKLQRSAQPAGVLTWATVPGASNIPGNGGEMTVEDPAPASAQSSFYRVLALAW